MADTFSPLLNLRLQQTGGNDNTWGDLLNSDVITALENAVAGVSTHAVTGGTLDLSATPLVHQMHNFTGVLSSDLTVIIPNLAKRMTVTNGTTGAFAMLLKTSAGSAISVPQSTTKDVLSFGGNVYGRLDKPEIGEIKYFGATAVPPGYLECDGSAISRTLYPELFAAIGTTWGVGNGSTTFNLPDLKTSGRFIRSRSGSVAVGTVQADQNKAHVHTGSTNVDAAHAHSGTTNAQNATHTHSGTTGAQNATHHHPVPAGPPGTSGQFSGNISPNNGWGGTPGTTNSSIEDANHGHDFNTSIEGQNHGHTFTSNTDGAHSHAFTTASDGGTEARPLNVSMLACIRY